MSDVPRIGDSVWVVARSPHKQPNGYVKRLLGWGEDREVMVQFHDCPDWETYSVSTFENTYTSKFGGGWWLEDVT